MLWYFITIVFVSFSLTIVVHLNVSILCCWFLWEDCIYLYNCLFLFSNLFTLISTCLIISPHVCPCVHLSTYQWIQHNTQLDLFCPWGQIDCRQGRHWCYHSVFVLFICKGQVIPPPPPRAHVIYLSTPPSRRFQFPWPRMWCSSSVYIDGYHQPLHIDEIIGRWRRWVYGDIQILLILRIYLSDDKRPLDKPASLSAATMATCHITQKRNRWKNGRGCW